MRMSRVLNITILYNVIGNLKHNEIQEICIMENIESKDMFERNLKELEGVVKQLESGEVTLEEMLSLFENGIKLTKECTTALDKTEQKINVLIKNRDNGKMEEQPFGGMGE